MSLEKLHVFFQCLFPIHVSFMLDHFTRKKFLTSRVPPTVILECVPPICDLCSASDHNSYSCPQYVQLRAKIENSIETAFNLMEHMMGNIFNQLLVQTQNKCNIDEEAHMIEEIHLRELCAKVIVELSSTSLKLISPICKPYLS